MTSVSVHYSSWVFNPSVFFFHQIFESQLIIRDTVFFLFFFLKHADTSDGLGMAALVLVGVRDAAINEESEARRPWTLVPSDVPGVRAVVTASPLGRGRRRRPRRIPCAGFP
jgi:hypothetical protein